MTLVHFIDIAGEISGSGCDMTGGARRSDDVSPAETVGISTQCMYVVHSESYYQFDFSIYVIYTNHGMYLDDLKPLWRLETICTEYRCNSFGG